MQETELVNPYDRITQTDEYQKWYYENITKPKRQAKQTPDTGIRRITNKRAYTSKEAKLNRAGDRELHDLVQGTEFDLQKGIKTMLKAEPKTFKDMNPREWKEIFKRAEEEINDKAYYEALKNPDEFYPFQFIKQFRDEMSEYKVTNAEAFTTYTMTITRLIDIINDDPESRPDLSKLIIDAFADLCNDWRYYMDTNAQRVDRINEEGSKRPPITPVNVDKAICAE